MFFMEEWKNASMNSKVFFVEDFTILLTFRKFCGAVRVCQSSTRYHPLVNSFSNSLDRWRHQKPGLELSAEFRKTFKDQRNMIHLNWASHVNGCQFHAELSKYRRQGLLATLFIELWAELLSPERQRKRCRGDHPPCIFITRHTGLQFIK